MQLQAAPSLAHPSSCYLLPPTTKLMAFSVPSRSMRRHPTSQTHRPILKAKASAVGQDPSTVDYSSVSSVFPAEACETVGGEACDVEMYPEVKLKPEAKKGGSVSEAVDREYLQYDSPKTVFPAEACDDLGGEFCDPEYQKGVY
ncbi:light-regulated protein, chloroplastic-like [Cucurbita maxima]|uniref:Light-regulated protein, chloroplastic-like n=1 Tax=Cucurbita maxima TaxID=3661 RepID=A0A6J1JSC1_CUCMA|nr:light-regulated protein, chloroplastic-like [Cucurbita maxima]